MSDGLDFAFPLFSMPSACPHSRSGADTKLIPDLVGPGFPGRSSGGKIAFTWKIPALGILGISFDPDLHGQSPGKTR